MLCLDIQPTDFSYRQDQFDVFCEFEKIYILENKKKKFKITIKKKICDWTKFKLQYLLVKYSYEVDWTLYLLGILCAIFLNAFNTQRTQDLHSLRKQHSSGLLRRRLAKEFLQMVIFQIKMAENVPLYLLLVLV